MKIEPQAKLLFIGDSITDAGRDPSGNPTPWNLNAGLGRGYVDLVAAHFGVVCPQHQIRVMNLGISGNTVRDLAFRWETDVIALQSDWVSVMIGINDVWRQFDQPLVHEAAVLPDEYARTLDALLARTPGNRVVMSPFMIEPNLADPMRVRMDEYGSIARSVAAKHGALFVDIQAAFDRILQTLHPMSLAWDRIHPNTIGHLTIARAFLAAVGAPS